MKLPEIQSALSVIYNGQIAGDLENNHLDFKQDPATVTPRPGNPAARLVELAIDAAVCFANGYGGSIIIGVDDHIGGPGAVVGTDVDGEWLRRKIFNGTRPNLSVLAREFVFQGKRILALDVNEGLDLYTDSKGRASVRDGSACKPLSEEARRGLAWERRNPDSTVQPSPRTQDDIDNDALRYCRELLIRLADERAEISKLSDRALLRRLGVVDESGQLLRAGEILLCRPDSPSVTYLRRTASGAEPQADRTVLPLVLAHRWLLDRVEAFRRTEISRVQLADGQELAIADYPTVAVDEAVTNALAHRDWQVEQPVVVDHSPQILRVWSPGGLPAGVLPDRLLSTVSRPRNPRLMNALRVLGLSEMTSRGVDRMYRAMVRTGRSAPAISVDDFSVEVVFASGAPNRAFASFVARLPDHLRENTHALLVLHYLCSHRSIRLQPASTLLQTSAEEARQVLAWLSSAEAELIQPTGSDGAWQLCPEVQAALGTAVSYRTRIGRADDQIIEHLREYGWITNRTVRNMLRLDLQQARAALGDLKRRAIVVKDPEGPARGPGVRWLPGPSAFGRGD